ncbi:MAG: 4-phosphoerythronate dehydrogenase [Rikenellaceae bacterium]
MKIIVDDKIPYIKGVFDPFFEVEYIAGSKISADSVRDCDALVVRTRTLCNESLLSGSRVKVIVTATIGMDHIDMNYCQKEGIEVRNAAGCNASAVVQYVLAVAVIENLEPGVSTIGIVGYGNIGSLLAQRCKDFGFKVLAYDPFKEGDECLVDELELLLSNSDLVTLHVPLTKDGKHKSFKMVDKAFFSKIKQGAIFVNTSRGEVVDERSLLEAIESGHLKSVAVDVWCNEPLINSALLQKANYSTTHIAGYSRRGKERATEMAVRAVASKFSIKELLCWAIESTNSLEVASWSELKDVMAKYFDIAKESSVLKSDIEAFEKIREQYNYREEFTYK